MIEKAKVIIVFLLMICAVVGMLAVCPAVLMLKGTAAFAAKAI